MKAAAVWAYGYAYGIEAHQIVQRQVWSIVSDAEILDHYETNQSPPRGPELRLRTQERYQCKSSLSTAVPHSITSAAVATSCARATRGHQTPTPPGVDGALAQT